MCGLLCAPPLARWVGHFFPLGGLMGCVADIKTQNRGHPVWGLPALGFRRWELKPTKKRWGLWGAAPHRLPVVITRRVASRHSLPGRTWWPLAVPARWCAACALRPTGFRPAHGALRPIVSRPSSPAWWPPGTRSLVGPGGLWLCLRAGAPQAPCRIPPGAHSLSLYSLAGLLAGDRRPLASILL
jgi:hypothetical protein